MGMTQREKHAPLHSGRLADLRGGDLVEEIHLARYRFAAGWTEACRVLDIACGIGYGSHLLSCEGLAGHVDGVDISEEAIVAARARYVAANLRFHHVGEEALPFASGTFEVVVSLETIEHVESASRFLEEIHRVLREQGVLVISTPNRRFHSIGMRTPWNPFHQVEFTPEEFRRLLESAFHSLEFWGGQEFLPCSLGTTLRHNWREFRYHRLDRTLAGQVIRKWGSGIKHALIRKPGGGDAQAQELANRLAQRTRVLRWVSGREPYTLVAVCRKSSTTM